MINTKRLPWLVVGTSGVALLLLAGCSTQHPRSGIMQEQIEHYQQAYSLGDVPAEPINVVENMPLQDALTLALQSHPVLRGSQLEVDGAQGRMIQEGLWLNPELEVEVENFGGTGEFESFDAAEFTVALGQTFELGGKRRKRRMVAELEMGLAEWEYVLTWLDVVAETSKRFADVQAARSELALAESDADISQRIHDTVVERVAAGRDSVLEEMKAKSLLASAELSLSRAQRDVRLAIEQLQLMWGETDVELVSVVLEQANMLALPPLEDVLPLVDVFPEVQRMALEVALAEAAVESARADRIPDVSLAGGYKQSRGDDEQMFVAGAGVELPLFNRNQGGILESTSQLSKVQTEALFLKRKV